MIPHTYIKASLLFAAKNDTRHYLNGALFERTANEARIAATNGRALVVMRWKCEGATPMSVIIPRETLEIVARWKQPNVNPLTVDITGPDATGRYTVSQGDNAALFTPVEGTFPPYRRVVPETLSGEVAQFDPEYVMAAQKACKLLVGKSGYVTMRHNGDGAAIADIGHADTCIVVMPMRSDAGVTPHDWAQS